MTILLLIHILHDLIYQDPWNYGSKTSIYIHTHTYVYVYIYTWSDEACKPSNAGFVRSSRQELMGNITSSVYLDAHLKSQVLGIQTAGLLLKNFTKSYHDPEITLFTISLSSGNRS